MNTGRKSTHAITLVRTLTGCGSRRRWQVTTYCEGRVTGRYEVMDEDNAPPGLCLSVGTSLYSQEGSPSGISATSSRPVSTIPRWLVSAIWSAIRLTLRRLIGSKLLSATSFVAGSISAARSIRNRVSRSTKERRGKRKSSSLKMDSGRSGTRSDAYPTDVGLDKTPWSERDFT